MLILTCSDEDDDATDPVDGVHDSLLAVLAVRLTQTTDDLNCRCNQNDDTEDCVNLSALKGVVYPSVFYTYFVSAIISKVN